MLLGGVHNINIKVGFYTQVLGLGSVPQEVTLGTLYCPNGDTNFQIGALDNFWRAAENFQTNNKVTWAVSQAAPLRRIVVNNDIDLYKYDSGDAAGYASGGFMADM